MADNELNYVNSILSKAMGSPLRNKFEERISELGITKNQAVENLEISTRALDSILDGTIKQVDFISLLKIGQLLEIKFEEVSSLFAKAIASKHKVDLDKSQIRSYIINNFDLPVLKAAGIIDSIRDFEHIEQRLCRIFDVNSILDIDLDETGAAFSSGTRLPKNLNSRRYFISQSKYIFKLIGNPNTYSKEALVEYFPSIRWHSMDLENGLIKVIQSLYKVGVTVVFRPKIPKLNMRGATFAVDDKPCIVLTDFRGYYPTLWFALLHELFHVLFDWDDIQKKKYHLSIEGADPYTTESKENEANAFAREYMFSNENMEIASGKINERLFIREIAIDNQVHPSVIYANYAYDHSTDDEKYFAKFADFFPPMKNLLKKLGSGFENTSENKAIATYYKTIIFN